MAVGYCRLWQNAQDELQYGVLAVECRLLINWYFHLRRKQTAELRPLTLHELGEFH